MIQVVSTEQRLEKNQWNYMNFIFLANRAQTAERGGLWSLNTLANPWTTFHSENLAGDTTGISVGVNHDFLLISVNQHLMVHRVSVRLKIDKYFYKSEKWIYQYWKLHEILLTILEFLVIKNENSYSFRCNLLRCGDNITYSTICKL